MDSFPFLWTVQHGGYGWSGAAQAAEAAAHAAARAAAADRPPQSDFPTGSSDTETVAALDLADAVTAAKAFDTVAGRKGLFLTFAQTPPHRQEIAYFLYRFGLNKTGRKLPTSANFDKIAEQVSVGASIEKWIEHRWEMSRLVELWLLVGTGHCIDLQRHIRWCGPLNGSRWVEYDSRPDMDLPGSPKRPVCQEIIASNKVNPEWIRLFKENDVTLPALVYLQSKLNARLSGEIASAVLYDEKKKKMRLHAVPRTFLAALWLQFAQAVDEDKKYRQCVVCGAYFEESPEIGRSSRKFCSDACRSRLYRERQELAQRLHEEGRTPRQIARQLETDVQTVRGWIELKG